MPIEYRQGDLLASPATMLVIPVNCVGVAGKGLALQCKQQYPDWFSWYRSACESHILMLGCPVLQRIDNYSHYFISFPTKDHWRSPSRLECIEQGLQQLVQFCGPWRVPEWTFAVPQLGCGAGGLSWSHVQPVMEHYLSQLPCTVWIYIN
jgi:O-acetyl-ADP-ribose deacetylase (regulator of RNase III)